MLKPMKLTRRQLLQKSAFALAAVDLAPSALAAAAPSPVQTHVRPKMHLGLVTYNLAKDWSVETIINHCQATSFEGVELRTTHAHKVEVNLSPAERAEV